MRLSSLAPLAVGLLIVSSSLQAADETYRIARWGHSLLVTAPGGTEMSRAESIKLNQRMTLDFQDAPLTDVVDFLRDASKMNIVVAPAVLLSAPNITLKSSNMSLGNVLNWVTKLSNTNFGFLNGALYISDKPIVEASVTKIYDISDMTLPIRDFPGPEMSLNGGGQNGSNSGAIFKQVGDTKDNAPTTEEVEDIIKKVIAPGKWNE
jgi:hypothetical protein